MENVSVYKFFTIFAATYYNLYPQTIMHQNLIYFNSRDELLRLNMSRIVYFEADGNYTNIVLTNKLKCKVGMNLSQMFKTLEDRMRGRDMFFARIGKRFIVNMNFVMQLNVLKHRLVLSDGEHFSYAIDISKEALKKLKELIIKTKV